MYHNIRYTCGFRLTLTSIWTTSIGAGTYANGTRDRWRPCASWCPWVALRAGFIFDHLGGNLGEWNFRKIEFCQDFLSFPWKSLSFWNLLSFCWVSSYFCRDPIIFVYNTCILIKMRLHRFYCTLHIEPRFSEKLSFVSCCLSFAKKKCAWVLENVEFCRPWVLKK